VGKVADRTGEKLDCRFGWPSGENGKIPMFFCTAASVWRGPQPRHNNASDRQRFREISNQFKLLRWVVKGLKSLSKTA
jgi:hypothetical protein